MKKIPYISEIQNYLNFLTLLIIVILLVHLMDSSIELFEYLNMSDNSNNIFSEYNNATGSNNNMGSPHNDPGGQGDNASHMANTSNQSDDSTQNNNHTASETFIDVSQLSEEEKNKLLKTCMREKLQKHRIDRASTNPYDTTMGDKFTGAEHEYVCDLIVKHDIKTGERPGLRFIDMVVGRYPDRRYLGPVSVNLLKKVFSDED